jgi:hypothetical protein
MDCISVDAPLGPLGSIDVGGGASTWWVRHGERVNMKHRCRGQMSGWWGGGVGGGGGFEGHDGDEVMACWLPGWGQAMRGVLHAPPQMRTWSPRTASRPLPCRHGRTGTLRGQCGPPPFGTRSVANVANGREGWSGVGGCMGEESKGMQRAGTPCVGRPRARPADTP